ncbi:hypothetical protein IQ216_09585 [Cyanobium sp. LEGE 06143]|uniref:hypothetical protein n=1 Tax=Cyanobium sp. LEGE 06143 TaxID=945727 RepID=UPI00188041EA|nr:hypothetical protein [Cyanobium sp. LEGE 06143]MBE9173322.1 hypothetical protein [Cyanobium sp. LEGE 06143]
MAIFTAIGSGQTLTGTDNPDLFILSATTSLSVIGQGGADTVDIDTVSAEVILQNSFVTLKGGPDRIAHRGVIFKSVVQLGAGGDTMTVSEQAGLPGIIDDSVIKAGDGNDNIQVMDEVIDSTIEMGAGADSLYIDDLTSGVISMGAGADTLRIDQIRDSSVINLGGGADLATTDGVLVESSLLAAGAGSDTVSVEEIIFRSTVQLGGDADKLFARSVIESTINGGAGGDTIVISGSLLGSTVYGDAGNDSIVLLDPISPFDGELESDSARVFGGDGADTIFAGPGFEGELNVFGGHGADLIQLTRTSEVDVKYTNASESNVNSFDTLQAIDAGTTAIARINVTAVLPQEVKIASSIIGANFNTDNSGEVTFKAGVGASIEDRVSVLNEDLNAGQFVLFDAEGSQFVFMAGNDASSTDDDILIRVADNAVVGGLSTGGNASVFLEFFS